MSWKIPLFKTEWEEADVSAVSAVIRRGAYWATGPEIDEFEKKLIEFTGRKYALTFNSGTSALHAMFDAFGLAGKEVIVPSFTFVATANAVVLAGGKPIFAESEEETYGLDADDVLRKITKHTGAVVALHYAGGISRDIERLRKMCDEKGILLLEDNAHSLGVMNDGRMCGTFGDAAALSFCQNKLITTGEGGAVITDSRDAYEKMKLFRSHGRVENLDGDYFSSSKDNDYITIGYNYRMPTMCAALGLSQLKRYKDIVAMRVKSAGFLSKGLSKIDGVAIPKPFHGSDHYYQMYTIMLEDKKTRDGLQSHLTSEGIMTKPYYQPVHLKTFYMQKYGYKAGDLPKTEMISDRILTLPMYPGLPKEEADMIIRAVKNYFER